MFCALRTQVRPDGSGLHKLFDSHGGLANHPKFSPDAKRIVFTSDYAGAALNSIFACHIPHIPSFSCEHLALPSAKDPVIVMPA